MPLKSGSFISFALWPVWLAGSLALCGCGRGLDPLAELDAASQADSSPNQGCPGLALAQVRSYHSGSGSWTLHLPLDAQYRQVSIDKPGPREEAAAVDWESGDGDVSGLVLSWTTAGANVEELALQVATRIGTEIVARKVASKAFLLHAGEPGVSPEGYPTMAQTMLRLERSGSVEPHWIRKNLYPILLGGDLTRFGNIPEPSQERSSELVLLLATTLRPEEGRLVLTGGVATLHDYDSQLSKSRIRASDMAGGALLGGPAARLTPRCDLLALPSASAAVDVIWVVDEGTTMAGERTYMHNAISVFWSEASQLGLDLRMAVVSMGRVLNGGAHLPAQLCNPPPNSTPGGLWSSTYQTEFNSCFLGPSGFRPAGQGRYGLANLRESLGTLLPRSNGQGGRLRTGASLVVIFAADGPSELAAELFGGQVPWPMTPAQRSLLDDLLQPFADLLRGRDNPANRPYLPAGTPASTLAGTRLYALVTDPAHGCGRLRGTGFLELVQALGGGVDLLCLPTQYHPDEKQETPPTEGIEQVFRQIVRDLASSLRPMKLAHVPLASSLAVAGASGSLRLIRSYREGFDVNLPDSSLLLYGSAQSLALLKGQIRSSYLGW